MPEETKIVTEGKDLALDDLKRLLDAHDVAIRRLESKVAEHIQALDKMADILKAMADAKKNPIQ